MNVRSVLVDDLLIFLFVTPLWLSFSASIQALERCKTFFVRIITHHLFLQYQRRLAHQHDFIFLLPFSSPDIAPAPPSH